MKKFFNRYKRQTLALVLVFLIAFATCISISADEDTLPTFPSDIDDGSMIITYSKDDTYTVDSSPFVYNYQVLPPSAFDDYDSDYSAYPSGNIYYFLEDDVYSTQFTDNFYHSTYSALTIDRTLTIHDIPLTSDNYIAFDLYYYAHYNSLNASLTLTISYRLNDTSTSFTRSFEYDVPSSVSDSITFDTSALYSILDVDPTLTLNIDTLEFRLYCEYADPYPHSVNFRFNVYYNQDTIFTYSPSDEPTDDPTDEPSDIPSEFFRDYTSWLAVAVGGFFSFELFPNFYLGGIIVVLIAFSLVMWWLKMFGGG